MTSGRALARFSGATGLRARSTAASVIGRPLTVAATFRAGAAGGAWANAGTATKTAASIPSVRSMGRASDGSGSGRR